MIQTDFFTSNDMGFWINPGTYILLMNYSISGQGNIGLSAYNFTEAEPYGFYINFEDPNESRGDIVRAITVTQSSQIGIHATGSITNISAQVTAVKLK